VSSFRNAVLDGHFDLRAAADALLADPRIAVVALPEPDTGEKEYPPGFVIAAEWDAPGSNTICQYRDGEIAIDGHIGALTHVEAIQLAAALLAAVAHNNRTTTTEGNS
jgi:hypothetical protein